METTNSEKHKFRTSFTDSEKRQLITARVGMKGSGKSAMEKLEVLPLSPRVVIFDPKEEYVKNTMRLNSLNEIASWIKEHPKYFRIAITDLNIIDDVLEFVYDLGDIKLVLEEVALIVPTSTERLDGPIENIVFRGRHQCVDLDIISQRMAMINIHLRSQIDIFNIFRQIEASDVSLIQKLTGLEYTNITNLSRGDYIEFGFEGVKFKEVSKLKKLLKIS
jgi:hypothetical protein